MPFFAGHAVFGFRERSARRGKREADAVETVSIRYLVIVGDGRCEGDPVGQLDGDEGHRRCYRVR